MLHSRGKAARTVFFLTLAGVLVLVGALFLSHLCGPSFGGTGVQRRSLSGLSSSVASDADEFPSSDETWFFTEVDVLHRIVEEQSPEAALAKLRADMDRDPQILRQCHGLAHEIGHEAYKKEGFPAALNFEDDICGSGYLHGVIESHFAKIGNVEDTMKTVCDPGNAKCFHGVGHGLMFSLENDLPRAAALCQTYPQKFQQIQCAEGIYMENYNTDFILHPSRFLDATNPFVPCPSQPEIFKGVCYFYAPRFYLRLHPDNDSEALAWCDGAEGKFRDACAKGVGSVVMKFNIAHPEFVEQVCESHGSVQEPFCIQGLSSYTLVNFASVSRALAICRQLKPDHRKICENVVDQGRPFFGE